jgi:hypothetical protein
MQPIQQLVAALVAADRLADVEELARWEAGIKPTGFLESLGWEDGEFQVAFTAEYEVDGRPMTFRTVNGKDMLDLPLADSTLAAVKETGVEPLATLDRAKVDLVVRERATAAEFFQPVEFSRERLPDTDSTFRSVLMAKSSVDIEAAANGAPLGAGIWDVLIRISSCGWTKETRLGALRADDVEDGREGSLSAWSCRTGPNPTATFRSTSTTPRASSTGMSRPSSPRTPCCPTAGSNCRCGCH